MTIKNRIIKIGLPIIYLLGWIILYLLPRKFFHNGGDNALQMWLLFIVMFLFLPFILKKILKKHGLSEETSKGIAHASFFLAIPFMIFIEREINAELKQHQEETIGTVTDTWMSNPRSGKGSPVRHIEVKYYVNGKDYKTTPDKDEDEILSRGDNATVFYSSKTPEISSVKELIEYYGE